MRRILRLLVAVAMAAACLAAMAPAQASFSSKPVWWVQAGGNWSGSLTLQAVLADGTPMSFENVPATGSLYIREDCLLALICFGNYSFTMDGSPTTPALSASGPTFFGTGSWHAIFGWDMGSTAMMPSTLHVGTTHLDFGWFGWLYAAQTGLNGPSINLSPTLGATPTRWCPTEATCQRIELVGGLSVHEVTGVAWDGKHID